MVMLAKAIREEDKQEVMGIKVLGRVVGAPGIATPVGANRLITSPWKLVSNVVKAGSTVATLLGREVSPMVKPAMAMVAKLITLVA